MNRQKQKRSEFIVQLIFYSLVGVITGVYLYWGGPLNTQIVGIIITIIGFDLMWLLGKIRGKDYFGELDTIVDGIIFGIIFSSTVAGFPSFFLNEITVIDLFVYICIGAITGGITVFILKKRATRK